MKCICGGNILIRSKGHSVTGIACTKERMGKCKEAMR